MRALCRDETRMPHVRRDPDRSLTTRPRAIATLKPEFDRIDPVAD
jgi:hypothetical protein